MLAYIYIPHQLLLLLPFVLTYFSYRVAKGQELIFAFFAALLFRFLVLADIAIVGYYFVELLKNIRIS
jgi:hypothetical protein